MSEETQRRLAIELYNAVWDVLDKPERTPEDDERMLHMAHASRFHFGELAEPVYWARGEGQCSRVYAVLRRAEPAVHHAERMLALCTAHGLGDYDLGCAYEALARAHTLAGAAVHARRFLSQATAAANRVDNDEERELLQSDLRTIPWLGGTS